MDMLPEERKAIIREITVFFDHQFDQEVSEFRAGILLDFFLAKLAPAVYNSAIEDARAFLAERLEDMEATLFARAQER